ncbi:MAG: M12 family metallo-peptidase [Gammaproteobacteria bacterium]|nr:M12 family metallo-peptidase [Gammaproteobacteria bacterium]
MDIKRLILLGLSILIVACEPTSVSQEPSIFRSMPKKIDATDLPDVLTMDREEVLRSRFVRFDFKILESKLLSVEDPTTIEPIEINLFDDLAIRIRTDDVQRREGGIYVWSGIPASEYYGVVSLSFNEHTIFGTIQADGTIYEITPVKDDIVMIAEINQARYQEEGPPIIPPKKYEKDSSEGPDAAADHEIGHEELKVLVVLPLPSYRFICRGSFPFVNILAIIESAYENNLNKVFNAVIATGIHATVEIECHDYNPIGDDLTADLSWVRTDAGIATLRDNHDADLVSLIVPSADFCGRAYENYPVTATDEEWAYSVVKGSCALGNYSFAHELGHNIGMRHDRTGNNDFGSSTCNYGHVYPLKFLFFNMNMRTVMAYGSSCNGCSRAGVYSTPTTISFGFISIGPFGVACNVPASGGNYRRANNRQQLITAEPVVSAFR